MVQESGLSADEQAIRSVVGEMTEAFNQRDARRLAGLYTADADLVNVYGTWLHGRPAIENGLRGMFEHIIKDSKLTTREVRVRFVHPDVAIAHVLNELRDQPPGAADPGPSQPELSLRVFRKDGQVWRVAAFHNTIRHDR